MSCNQEQSNQLLPITETENHPRYLIQKEWITADDSIDMSDMNLYKQWHAVEGFDSEYLILANRYHFAKIPEVQEFITLDNGTLADTRILAVHGAKDFELIIGMILRHFDAMNSGDADALISTLSAQDGSDFNFFNPSIINTMNGLKHTGLFVEKIELSSFGDFKISLTNIHGTTMHIWVELAADGPWDELLQDWDYVDWFINRYLNHHSMEWWLDTRPDLWEYAEPFHAYLNTIE